MLHGVFGKALAFAGLTAVVWAALALQMAAHVACAGPTVALVKPFGQPFRIDLPGSKP